MEHLQAHFQNTSALPWMQACGSLAPHLFNLIGIRLVQQRVKVLQHGSPCIYACSRQHLLLVKEELGLRILPCIR